MNVLQIIPSLKKGGAERLVLDICTELQKRQGVNLKLVVLHPENSYEFLSKNINLELCNSKISLSVFGKNIIDLDNFERIVYDFRPDIIHSHLFESEIISRWKTFPNVKYFTHGHDKMKQLRNFSVGILYNKELFTNYFEKKLLAEKYRACNNYFIAISRDTEIYLKKNLPPRLTNNIYLLHNAINFDLFKCERAFVHNNVIELVNIGSFVDKKNQIFLIDVVSILKGKGYDTKLHLLGEGMNRSLIQDKINETSLNDSVFLHGNVDNVEEYLIRCNIYVHSALYEPFGLVILEAMASGLPVICLDGKGNRDIIKNGENGYMVYKNDPEMFADKIIEVFNNSDLYASMSRFASDYANNFDIKNYVTTLLNMYNGVF